MIIKDLIELCPVEEIVSEIMLMCGVDESEREGISRNHTAFINHLKKKTPIDTGYVILGITYMDEGKEYLDASLFEKCELQEFFKLQNPVPDRSSVDTLTLEEIMQLLSQLRVPENYGFELSPWEEILGYEVDPQNVTKVGAAKQVGVGAVIFHDLKNDRLNTFDFNLEEVVRFEGETGPYVQYTHARAVSLLAKADFTPSTDQEYALNDENSWEVVKLIQKYPETVLQAGEKYEPSIIAKHAIKLAQAFNKYYAHTKILVEDDQKEARLALVYAVTVLLKEDLRLLGLHAPDKM